MPTTSYASNGAAPWTSDNLNASSKELESTGSMRRSKSKECISCDDFLQFDECTGLPQRTPIYLEELRISSPSKLHHPSLKNTASSTSFPSPSHSPFNVNAELPSFMKPIDQDVDLAWFDEQRRLFSTYEYMCRIQEAKEWIEDTLGDKIDSCSSLNDFEEILRDGVLLCRLMRCFAPECIKRIFTAATLQFRHSDNLVYFWNGCKKLGLPAIFTFELVDLYDKKNIPKVIYCLHALSHLVYKKGLGSGIKNLQGKVIFNENDVRQKDAELASAGISMPAFNKVSQLIGDHLDQEKTEETPSDNIDSIILTQAYIKRLIAIIDIDTMYVAAQIIQSSWKRAILYDNFLYVKNASELLQSYIKSNQLFLSFDSFLAANSIIHAYLRTIRLRQLFLAKRKFATLMQNCSKSQFVRKFFLLQKYTLLYQTLLRRSYVFNSFKRITSLSPSIALYDIFKFLSLFEVGNTLLLKEIELDQVRLAINKKINDIQEKEEHLSDLDVKVGLLLRNTLSLQDFIKDTSRNIVENSSNSTVPPSNASALLRLDRDNHTKLKQYRQLFYLLQTDPKYLTEILTEMPISKAKSFIDDCVLALFGHGQSSNEEYLLLGLSKSLIEKEIYPGMSIEEFMASDFLFARICLHYARGAKEITYLKSLLGPLIDEIIGNDFISFETDPLNIYRDVINQEEMESGQKSSLPFDVTREEAFQNQQVKEKYIENLRSIQTYSRKFISAIIASAHDVPYSIKFALKEIFARVQDARLLGHFIYYRYLNPAIVSPETFDVLERPISSSDRKNLAEISRMFQFIVLGKSFSFQDCTHLIPLNDFLSQTGRAFYSYLADLIDISEPRDHFSIPADIPIVESDYVLLSLQQIYKIHDCLCTWSTLLKDIVLTLGNAPRVFQNDQATIRIDLMKPRNLTVYQVDGHLTLLLHVKKFLLVVFGCCEEVYINNDSADTLPQFLALKTTPVEENNFSLFFESNQFNDSISVSSLPAEYLASLASLKACLLSDLEKLEGFNGISQYNNYTEILLNFARDLRDRPSKHRYITRELSAASRTMNNLEEKAFLLDSRIQAINEYVKSAIQVLSSNAKPKKPLPFTKHYSHFKNLEKQGRMPQFGSYKYTVADLYNRGIIYSIAEYSVSQYDKISIVISSNEPGVFTFEATLMGIKIPQTAIVRLEDLLDCQFNNIQKMSLFGGIAKVNVNLLIHFLNKKFFE